MLALQERLEAKYEAEPLSGCWLWTGALTRGGYGQIGVWFGGVMRPRRAHRVAYECYIGPIPDGLELDHLCRVRTCVNPRHLEPVTHAVNVARGGHALKTHAPCGHPYTKVQNGTRRCIPCRNKWHRERRQHADAVSVS